MKKSLKLMAATGALAAMCAMPMQAASVNVNLAINGVPVHADASMGAPFVTDNNRTMIPLRLVGEMVDCNVDYKDGVVTITNDAYDYSAIFKKDATTCTINGETKALDAPMVFTNGRSYVPIRALGDGECGDRYGTARGPNPEGMELQACCRNERRYKGLSCDFGA